MTDTILASGRMPGWNKLCYQSGRTSGPVLFRSLGVPNWRLHRPGLPILELNGTITMPVASEVAGNTLIVLTASEAETWKTEGVQAAEFDLATGVRSTGPILAPARAIPLGVLKLASGAVVASWFDAGVEDAVAVRFSRRSPAGVWSPEVAVNLPLPSATDNTKMRSAMAQHPADGAIWWFGDRDAYRWIFAVRLIENGETLTVTATYPEYSSAALDGSNGPEGEFPHITAIADALRGTILLAYQREDSQTFAASVFLKGATIALCDVAANGVKSFRPHFPYLCERISIFLLSLDQGRPRIMAPIVNAGAGTANELKLSSFVGGAWTPLEPLAKLAVVPGDAASFDLLGHSDNAVAYYNDTSNPTNVHQIQVALLPPPAPPSEMPPAPEPVPEPTPIPRKPGRGWGRKK